MSRRHFFIVYVPAEIVGTAAGFFSPGLGATPSPHERPQRNNHPGGKSRLHFLNIQTEGFELADGKIFRKPADIHPGRVMVVHPPIQGTNFLMRTSSTSPVQRRR